MIRRFGDSSARVALYLQDQIVEVEKALAEEEELAIEASVDNGTFRLDQRPNRLTILEDLASKLERYRMPSPLSIRSSIMTGTSR